MNKVIGICLILLALGTVAEEAQESVKPPRVHEYKLVDGKMIRQGPLVLRYARTAAPPKVIAIHRGDAATDAEVIITSCRLYRRIRRVGYSHPNR